MNCEIIIIADHHCCYYICKLKKTWRRLAEQHLQNKLPVELKSIAQTLYIMRHLLLYLNVG